MQIYPADANLIVSLLDLHVSVQSQNDAAPLQILEAGTGHGALTLHLARAIHAANIDPTAHRQQLHEPAQGLVLYWLPKKALDLYWYAISLLRGRSAGHLQKHKYRPDKSISNSATPNSPAIVQTIDVSSRHSEHARMIVEGFRRGIYSKDVDFHVGSVSEWIERQLQLRSRKPFLSHAILDLPSSHNHIEKTASALYVDGSLLVFSPSITQINSTIHVVKAKKLRLQLDRVVEVGPAMTGGRVWDIRLVKPRATPDAHVSTSLNPQEEHTRQDGELRSGNGIEDHQMTEDDHNYEWVCRPKVGDRTSGGGFVALWKKNRSRNDF